MLGCVGSGHTSKGQLSRCGIIWRYESRSSPDSKLSDMVECQRTGLFAVDVGKSIFHREGGGHQHLSSVAEHIRVGREGRDGASDELGRFGIAQVKKLCGFRYLFRPDESRVKRDSDYAMRLQLDG